MKLYQAIATAIQARLNCRGNGNHEWFDRWTEKLANYELLLPSGSGFNSGSSLDLGRSNGEKIIITTSFHHMNDGGYYDGWTDHTITIKPSLSFGFTLSISGRNRNGIKEYIAEMFNELLNQEVEK